MYGVRQIAFPLKLESGNVEGNHMKRRVAVLAVFLGLMVATASAQAVNDVRSVLEASLKAMGGHQS